MSTEIASTDEAKGWLSVLGLLFAPAALRDDLDTFNALIDTLIAFLQPYATGVLTTDEPRVYHDTPTGRVALTEALRAKSVEMLNVGVADPAMPQEYRGTISNGPYILIYFRDIARRGVVGLTVSLTPSWSSFQATLVAHLLALLAEWAPRLNAYEAYVTGGNEGESRTVWTYHGPESWTQAVYSPGDRDKDYDAFLAALPDLAVPLSYERSTEARNRLTLPVRLLDDVRYRDDGFIVSRDVTDPVGRLSFHLYFDRALTEEERSTVWLAVNAWEAEFYARFDDDWFDPSRVSVTGAAVRWIVRAAQGFRHGFPEDEMSGNGVNERAMRELQDWLWLLPQVRVHELVIGTEVVE